nr:cardosin A=aspartic protease 31 kda subunit {N-terminal} [Cynara cardunculus=cardoon, flowers, Peptide Partial, 15 aa] [Cynara cardunculus]
NSGSAIVATDNQNTY